MALIKCPECRKKVSSTAPYCIKCGFVLNKENEENEVVFDTITPEIIILNAAELEKKEADINKALDNLVAVRSNIKKIVREEMIKVGAKEDVIASL
ncbi:MAG: zinc ribbon domain-containing protein [Clostridia bacterium]|nr:zinc ribbon domain-containing protein [Clostridia bacterium]